MNQQQSKTVLVVDDELSVRQLIRQYLEMTNYAVVEAKDGMNILRKIVDNHVDVVILDILMDNKEGMESIIEIRDQYPDLPVIMISSDPNYLSLSETLGATAIFCKPLNLPELEAAIRKYLR